MNPHPDAWHRTALLLMSLALAVSLGSCTGTTRTHVRPVPNNGYMALDADDVVSILIAAGFTEEEILATGTDFRNTIGQHGAAAIHRGDLVKALVACHPPYVYITTQGGRSFIYNAETKMVQ